MATQTRDYWNPPLETLPSEKLLAIELKNFREYIRYAKEHASFYRKRLHGVEPEDIKTKDDLRGLPLTDKEDLRMAQEREGPTIYGEILGVDPKDVTDFRQTLGTGVPHVEKNVTAILSFICVLKFGISDLAEVMDT